jgi:hypothetical protein
MRRVIGTIGATLAIAAFIATGVGSASHEASVPGGGKSFVGPADDPFFVDLGSVFDGINIDKPGRPMTGLGNQGGGQDDVSGFNAAFATGPTSDLKNFGGSALSPEPARIL